MFAPIKDLRDGHIFSHSFDLSVSTKTPHPARISGEGASFVGVWKGDSVCQIKESPCHDETSVYYVSKSAQRASR